MPDTKGSLLSTASSLAMSDLVLVITTPGGTAASQNITLANFLKSGYSLTTFSDANYPAVAADFVIGQTGTLTAPRTVTLPPANSVAHGYELIICDMSASVTTTNTITVQKNGTDTLNGAASLVISSAYGSRRFISDGVSKWFYDAGGLRANNNLSDLGNTNIARANLNAAKLNCPNVAVLGDSISFNNHVISASTKANCSKGYLTWLNIHSGHRFNLTVANNYGVSGDNLSQIAARVASVIASGVDLCVIMGGTNDLTQGNTFSAMQNTMLNSILLPLTAAGIQVVVIPILPRTGLTTTQALIGQRFNTWLKEVCLGTGYATTQATLASNKWPLIADPIEYMQDYTSTTGAPLTGYTEDGLHPNNLGAYWIGWALYQLLSPMYPARPTKQLAVMDYYDATNNPTGNLLGTSGSANFGLLLGTGGTNLTATSLVPTGVVPTGWRQFRGIGAGNATTLVGLKQNPRTDISAQQTTGERFQQTITLGGTGGLSDETFSLGLTTAINTSFISVGDTVYVEGCFEVTGTPSNLTGIELLIAESGPATPQTAFDNNVVAGENANFTFPLKGTLRSVPIVIQTGFSSLSVFTKVHMNATSNTGNCTILWSDFAVRKVAS